MLNLSKKDIKYAKQQIKNMSLAKDDSNKGNAIDTKDLTLNLPSIIIKGFYAQSTPHLDALKGGATINTASPQLDKINEKIRN